ncbi:hypothetical protein QkW1_70 [Ralstonia phage QkW1]
MGLTQQRLKELLNYDPETGEFTWRFNRKGVLAGCRAGTISYGYVSIRIDGVRLMAHRLAWLYMTGKWPADVIDHINLDKADNRFFNLHEATIQQNLVNQRGRSVSGLKGVVKVKGRWRAVIHRDGKTRHIGYFDTAEGAHEAYAAEANKLHGEFARAA